jgi:hypothetical protein
MKRKGIYKGKDAEGYEIYECPICGKHTYVGNWYEDGVLEDVKGCEHYTGVGGVDDMFKEEQQEEQEI